MSETVLPDPEIYHRKRMKLTPVNTPRKHWSELTQPPRTARFGGAVLKMLKIIEIIFQNSLVLPIALVTKTFCVIMQK